MSLKYGMSARPHTVRGPPRVNKNQSSSAGMRARKHTAAEGSRLVTLRARRSAVQQQQAGRGRPVHHLVRRHDKLARAQVLQRESKLGGLLGALGVADVGQNGDRTSRRHHARGGRNGGQRGGRARAEALVRPARQVAQVERDEPGGAMRGRLQGLCVAAGNGRVEDRGLRKSCAEQQHCSSSQGRDQNGGAPAQQSDAGGLFAAEALLQRAPRGLQRPLLNVDAQH